MSPNLLWMSPQSSSINGGSIYFATVVECATKEDAQ